MRHRPKRSRWRARATVPERMSEGWFAPSVATINRIPKKPKMTRFLISALLALAVRATTLHAEDKTITVFAAASLKNALDDVGTAFTKQSGIKVVVSYGASSALAKQIEQGAPADLFVSADLQWMDYGVQKKVIKDDTRVNLLGNKLVLIATKDAKIDHVTIGPGFDLAKLAGDGRVATGDVRAVPVGLYAKAALERLGAWTAVEPKIAMAENVRVIRSLGVVLSLGAGNATTRPHQRSCWIGRRLAICSARAAIGDADDWVSKRPVAGRGGV